MHEPDSVRVREGLERLEQVVDDLGERQRPLDGEQLLEVAALEVLHDEERRARRRGAGVHDAGDVLARDARGGLRLAREALDDQLRGRGVGQEDLHRHALLEHEVLGRVDDAHAALAGDLLEAVLAGDDVADLGHLVLGHAYRFSLTRASGIRAPNEGGQLGSIRVAPDENEASLQRAKRAFHARNCLLSRVQPSRIVTALRHVGEEAASSGGRRRRPATDCRIFSCLSAWAPDPESAKCAPCTHGRRLGTRTSPRASTTCSSRPRGDVVFRDTGDARRFADRVNAEDGRSAATSLRPAELAAMALVHEIFHAVIGLYREKTRGRFDTLARSARQRHSATAASARRSSRSSPRSRRLQSTSISRARATRRPRSSSRARASAPSDEITEELLLLWLTNQNPAYEPVRTIVTRRGPRRHLQGVRRRDAALLRGRARRSVPAARRSSTSCSRRGARPPTSILDQLKFIEGNWGHSLGLDQLALWRRVLWAKDFLTEEGKYFYRGGPGPGEPLMDAMRFGRRRQDEEPRRFSPDLDWMPHVVLVAKTRLRLARSALEEVRATHRPPRPDPRRGARSPRVARLHRPLAHRPLRAQQRVDARSSRCAATRTRSRRAYSLMTYDIAAELGGDDAYENLKYRAWKRGHPPRRRHGARTTSASTPSG